MIVEDERTFRLFQLLSTNPDQVKTARELSEQLNVSVRTVKNDMPKVKEIAEKSGVRIISKKREGYWAEIVNAEQFRPVEWQMHVYFNEVNALDENKKRAYEITRILISQQGYMTVDDIADLLHLSRSSIKTALKEMRGILREFQLELLSCPGKGLKVSGSELNLRFCILELFANHHVTAFSVSTYKPYCDYFTVGEMELGSVRRLLIESLHRHQIHILDNNIHRISRFVFVLLNRKKKGHTVEIDNKAAQDLKSMKEYGLACDFAAELRKRRPDVCLQESDILSLELLILMWNDLSDDDPIDQDYPLFAAPCEGLAAAILNAVRQEWGLEFPDRSRALRILKACLIPHYVQIHFNFIGYNLMIGQIVENNYGSSSPLSVALAMSAAQVIEDHSQHPVSEFFLLDMAVRFFVILNLIDYEYRPRRILLCSSAGYQSTAVLRRKLLHKFGPDAFARMDCAEFYEVRQIDQSQYDAVILNNSVLRFPYPIPHVCVDLTPSEKQLDQIESEIILDGYPLNALLKEIKFKPDFVFDEFHYLNRRDFIKVLSYRWARNPHQTENLRQSLMHYSDSCIYNETAVLILSQKYTGTAVFEIYRLERKGMWLSKEIKTILFLAVDFHHHPQRARFIEQLTYGLVSDQNQLESLIRTENLNDLAGVVKAVLK
ncbi:BglG family transcription antiterminator [Holdemania massiliensis]|uniref:BglG family transcription antiterminator n=1 Tax=Holdemania massiliensis TaxID=1468449 RepID=UPI001F058E59|nr:HTH domain-containing protein [Holdemania massiliensis]MCH1942650.1 HTH domain-containing protein [Holdemania massiliensis]